MRIATLTCNFASQVWDNDPQRPISANAFDDFQSTGLIGYDVPSKNRTRQGCR
jgi:hypothetical protein